MKKILMISFSNLKDDPRVRRHINFLKETYCVHTIGYRAPEIEGVGFTKVDIRPVNLIGNLRKSYQLISKNFDAYYWDKYYFDDVFKLINEQSFDLIIANDANTLPLAFKIKGNSKIIFDAHEYAPLEFEDSLYWRVFFQPLAKYICEKFIKDVDGMITVGDLIAKEYEKNFGKTPLVITNAPKYYDDIKPSLPKGNEIKIIHNGNAFPSRKIELMIEAMDYLDSNYKLYLMLLKTDEKYLERLKNIAKGKKNVIFLDPVNSDKVVDTISYYDIGLHIMAPTNFNNACALPNKFFEFVQARLAIVVGPSPEMANLVKKYNLGIVAEDFTPKKIAEAIGKLNKDNIFEFKNNAHKVAKELSAEGNKIKYLELVRKVINEE